MNPTIPAPKTFQKEVNRVLSNNTGKTQTNNATAALYVRMLRHILFKDFIVLLNTFNVFLY